MAGLRGVETPKVKPRGDRYSKGRRPDFLTRKQAIAFDKARRNFNRRIDYKVSKWQKIYPDATMEELARLGVVPWKYSKTLSDLEDKGQYQYLMKLFRSTKTKKYKAQFRKDMRERLKDVIAQAYFPSPEQMADIERIIDGMTEDELIRFNYDNAGMIGDLYDAYVENKEDDGLIDADQYEERLEDLMEALAPYRKGRA